MILLAPQPDEFENLIVSMLTGKETITFEKVTQEVHSICVIEKEWFFNFEEIDGGVVYLTNNHPCKVARIGSIYLKNHNGSTKMLIDVWYIPKFEKNLISLGTLESNDFTIIMHNGILKVVSGALVVMKGIRKNKLYVYQGSTLGSTIVAISEADKEAKMSKLWHMRLGHVGEKSLQTLAKQ